MKRFVPLATHHYYHIYNKSIYTYEIFNSPDEYERMLQLIEYYRCSQMPFSFSYFSRYHLTKYPNLSIALSSIKKEDHSPLVNIIAYCLMPTHMHFLLQQLLPNGICSFMKNIQSGYSQFFNKRHNRRGPLWQNRFGNKLISDDNDFARTFAYIHANPVKDLGLASSESWPYSSAFPNNPVTTTLPGSVVVTT